jgi:ubiquinone/menaquinone biosynthesis C-methylase UbiE
LTRLVELVKPQVGWRVLDVATGAGHTALAFAPHVATVAATDLTFEMLGQTRRLAAERGVENAFIIQNDAQRLPFGTGRFDLVTCRIAPHHFPDIGAFVLEAARVLRPGGLLAVADNAVPDTRLRGKKRRLADEAAAYINAFDALRDPGHVRALGMNEWQGHYAAAGLQLLQSETFRKVIDFESWVARMRVADVDRLRLRAMLQQAPDLVRATLTPQIANDRITFWLTEAILIGRKG